MQTFPLSSILEYLLLATRWTVLLSLIAILGGGVVGLVIARFRTSRVKWLSRVARGYIEIFQGTPLLLQLFLAFFGLSALGLDLSPWVAASLALTVYAGAFLGEMWRGCLQAVPKGQHEAAQSLALSPVQTLRFVVIPQALKIAVAPTVGFLVQLIKGTALTSIIGFTELTKAGTNITNATLQPFLVYGLVALIYFVLCYPLSLWSRGLERKLSPEGR